jgi:hypothetical protein
MKYLKKIFENDNYREIVEYLDTILIPLVDLEFDYKIQVGKHGQFSCNFVEYLIRQGHNKVLNTVSNKDDFSNISIEIIKRSEWWKTDLEMVSDVILSCALYLKDKQFLPRATAIHFADIIKTEYIDKLDDIQMLFKKSGLGVGVGDVFGNNIHKTSGVDNQYEYEIIFKK